jgi:hypothetical protein
MGKAALLAEHIGGDVDLPNVVENRRVQEFFPVEDMAVIAELIKKEAHDIINFF